MASRTVAAVDLGAESGRVMLARFDGGRCTLEEIHRFPNRPVFIRGHRFWNLPQLWQEILAGLRGAKTAANGILDSVGIDSWAIDYGLVDQFGLLRGLPYAYRDHRTDGAMERVLARIPRASIYAQTGTQFLPFNTLYQLEAQERCLPGDLASAHRMLLIPDLLHAWLGGDLVAERTNASTTQCWNPNTRDWATELLAALELPTGFLPPIIEPGTDLGVVAPAIQAEIGMAHIIAPATHDTGSAIAAVPTLAMSGMASPTWGYISSGTWSLVGVELATPVLTPAALAANCTNEGGIFGTTRFLKNVMGLWLLQECLRTWRERGDTWEYGEILAAAAREPAFVGIIEPDDPRFLAPDDMPATIMGNLRERGVTWSGTELSPPAIARGIMESLVLRSAQIFGEIADLTGASYQMIHVLGGGSRNRLMNQWLADCLGCPVMAGPAESTALGNALMQFVGLGELGSLADVRLIAQYAEVERFEPQPTQRASWQDALAHFNALR